MVWWSANSSTESIFINDIQQITPDFVSQSKAGQIFAKLVRNQKFLYENVRVGFIKLYKENG